MNDSYLFYSDVLRRAYDPLTLRRALLRESGMRFNEWLADTRKDGTLEAVTAYDKLLPVVRGAFGVEPVNADGAGVSEQQTMEALDEFLRWLSGKAPRG